MKLGSENGGRPAEAELRAISRYAQMDEGGLEIVSGPDKLLRVTVWYETHRVWLQERRRGAIQLETGRSSSDRRSTGSWDWAEAVAEADAEIQQRAIELHLDESIDSEARVQSEGQGTASLLMVRKAYLRHRFSPGVKNPVGTKHLSNVTRAIAVLWLKKGPDWQPEIEIARSPMKFVEWYIDLRTAGRIEFPESWNRRALTGCLTRTVIAELMDFSSALSIACDLKIIGHNPLRDFNYRQVREPGDAGVPRHRAEAPRNLLEILLKPPVCMRTGERLIGPSGDPLPAPVHRTRASDGGARLIIMLLLLAFMGHRESNYTGSKTRDGLVFPRVRDLVLTRGAVLNALDAAPNHNLEWADHWANGALVSNRNKSDFHRVLPLGDVLARGFADWMAVHPAPDDPHAALICSITNPHRPISATMLRKWFLDAVAQAHADADAMGIGRHKYLPVRRGSALGGLRPLWRTAMSELGWDHAGVRGKDLDGSTPSPDRHVLFFGGWSLSTLEVQAKVYNRLDPRVLLAVANMESAFDVYARLARERVDDRFIPFEF